MPTSPHGMQHTGGSECLGVDPQKSCVLTPPAGEGPGRLPAGPRQGLDGVLLAQAVPQPWLPHSPYTVHGPVACWDGQASRDRAARAGGTHKCFENIWPNARLTFTFSNIALAPKIKLSYSLNLHMPSLSLKPRGFHKVRFAWPQIAMSLRPLSKV